MFILQDPGQSKSEQQEDVDKQKEGEGEEEEKEEGVEMPEDFEGTLEDVEGDRDQDEPEGGGRILLRREKDRH